jgi:large subunit ribosomal protein L13
MIRTKATKQSEIAEKWYLVDAKGQRLGVVASKIAELLLAKDQPIMRDNLTPKNKVVVVNAGDLDVTARKSDMKVYTRYSGYPGGLTKSTLKEMINRFPERPLEKAVRGMLPRGKRGNHIFASNLYVYAGADHKHEAQNPVLVDLKAVKF